METQTSVRFDGANNNGFQLGVHSGPLIVNLGQYQVNNAEDKKNREKCLQRLSFQDMSRRKYDITDAADNTCLWLLSHFEYASWIRLSRVILWIRGKPGSGKSTLMKYLLQSVEQQNSEPEQLVLSFFFHGRGTTLQKTPLGLFRSLIHQILAKMPDLLAMFTSIYTEKMDTLQDWEWHVNELKSHFEDLVRRCLLERSIQIFVDALDESGEETAQEIIAYFERLADLCSTANSSSILRICFSCRHYPNISARGPTIDVENENNADITTYLYTRFEREWLDDDLENGVIIEKIAAKAAGVFQWAVLVASKIIWLGRNGENTATILEAIDHIPQPLEDLYKQLIQDIDPKHRSRSLRLFQWTCFTQRPLTSDEMRWAMFMDHNSDKFSLEKCNESPSYIETSSKMEQLAIYLSRGLIEVKKQGTKSILQIIHQSVIDYLLARGFYEHFRDILIYGAVGDAHYTLSRSSIKYILMIKRSREGGFEREKFDTSYPLLRYATTNWVAHADAVEHEGIDQSDLIELLQWPSNTILDFWISIYQRLGQSENTPCTDTTLLHLGCKQGYFTVIRAIMAFPGYLVDLNLKDFDGRDSLSLAAMKGHAQIVQLLQARLDIDVNSQDNDGQSPLSHAAGEGHKHVVKILLEHAKVLPDLPENDGSTPLIWAACRGHNSVIRLLHSHGSNPNITDKDGQGPLELAFENDQFPTVQLLFDLYPKIEIPYDLCLLLLFWAVENGHEPILRHLLARPSVKINVKNNMKWTPLMISAQRGYTAIISLLIEKGAKVDETGFNQETALSIAAENGHGTIVQLLKAHKADVDLKDVFSRSFLRRAVEKKNYQQARTLIENGANINDIDSFGRTALWWASDNEDIQMVDFLLEKNAKINIKDLLGMSPLYHAILDQNEAIARFLIDKGADIETKDKEGIPVLHRAAINGDASMIHLLGENGVTLEAKDHSGLTAMHHAVIAEQDIAVRILVKIGADINAKSGDGSTPLIMATSNRSSRMVKVLFDHSTDVDTDARGPFGYTALELAVDKGNTEVVELFLNHVADVNGRTSYGETLLHIASSAGTAEIAKVLLDHGADINARNRHGQTVLEAAVGNGNAQVVELFLKHGADANARDGYGNTILHRCQRATTDVLKLLLQYGADINAQNRHGQTVLEAAVADGNAQVVELFLKHGADANARDGYGDTILHRCQRATTDVLKLLLQYGADVNAQDDRGRTVLDLSTYLTMVDFLDYKERKELLLSHGARYSVDLEKGT